MLNLAKIVQTILSHDCLYNKVTVPFINDLILNFFWFWNGKATFSNFES